MRNRRVDNSVKKTAGIRGIRKETPEGNTGQEGEGNCRVLKEGCTDNESVYLEKVGLMGDRF